MIFIIRAGLETEWYPAVRLDPFAVTFMGSSIDAFGDIQPDSSMNFLNFVLNQCGERDKSPAPWYWPGSRGLYFAPAGNVFDISGGRAYRVVVPPPDF